MFETLTKPVNKNPFIYAQFRKRNSVNCAKDVQKKGYEARMNQVIFNA